MIFLSGKAGGSGDGAAVTDREARAELWRKRVAEHARLAPFLPTGLAPPPFPGGMMGMGSFPMGMGNQFSGNPFGGMMGGWPMTGGNPFSHMNGGPYSVDHMAAEARQYMDFLRFKDKQRREAARFLLQDTGDQ